ncbi:MAG: putative monovalent cation/H+ antiporter subunit B [Candidatus Accumulibacter sp. BA-94]|mgnify:CR=1 FL=1|uniref:Na(+)/H(+) antiporter subunit B n=1 Tax=Accumulibacter sp. TaxID=2053492 RepID=UPI00044DA7D3|nr:MnhB domain-containing protein [Accumulibacter sp.]EXI91108.1 MAG: putative monovalent cation/H+ antiporter subunit B [Candidatus Accumulibacter sp. BA-94]HCZ16758.1 sodium:proton antiporter [Accumulibacter sp.]HRD87214.1 MnhB domain-containing protein [Accumulibacter sp.]HRF71186.1 MnhB domain-containing protein [Accumulibacter sp.]
MKTLLVASVFVLAGVLGLALGWSMLDLPATAVKLPVEVKAQLAVSGVAHPVTAVLLNFRGYDTLLEIAVLLLALLAILALPQATSSVERCPASANRMNPMLQTVARLLVPLMVLVAGYVLWAGAYRPGGAFQAGAVLAGAGVLLHLAGLLPPWTSPGRALRVGLAFGLLVFIAVAAAVMLQGTLLQYPPAWAGALILLIEAGLTVSLALVLAGLYLALTDTSVQQ